MEKYKEILGDLILVGLNAEVDVVAQGNNCFCVQEAGLAPQFVKAFGTDKFLKEAEEFRGDINKLGTIDYREVTVKDNKKLTVVNCYSQFGFGINHKEGSVAPLDYEALALCFRKMNHIFKGKHIGLPQIGCHLAGGKWERVKEMIKTEFKDCNVTVVIFNNK